MKEEDVIELMNEAIAIVEPIDPDATWFRWARPQVSTGWWKWSNGRRTWQCRVVLNPRLPAMPAQVMEITWRDEPSSRNARQMVDLELLRTTESEPVLLLAAILRRMRDEAVPAAESLPADVELLRPVTAEPASVRCKAYVIAWLESQGGDSPVVHSVDIYSEGIATLTRDSEGLVPAEVMSASGATFEEAKANVLRQLQDWHPWLARWLTAGQDGWTR